LAFLDPRAGDLEDDASSTTRHTLLGHASRMLVEISLPKLALAVLLLVALPALLLGAAPKLGFWFTEAVWRQVADAGKALAIALTLLALGLVAWRWGARLFRGLEANFWALNGGLVQPMHMITREVVRAALERLVPPERLPLVRRRAGLLAGGLLALAAGGAALWLGPLPGFSREPPSLAALPGAAREALRNGLWFVCAYLAIAAPAWAIAEARTGQPETLPPPPQEEEEAAARWRVAHLSDIHVVGEPYGFRLESGRDGPRGNGRFARLLTALAEADAAAPLDWVLVSGDITDAGRNAEFIAFEAALAAHPALAAKTLIIPGNHDVNIVDRANPARLELPISPGGALRRVRFLGAAARLQGARVRLATPGGLGPSLAAFLAAEGRSAALERFTDRGGLRAARAARAICEACFPQVVPPATPEGLGVLLLDSNAATSFSFTNALGLVSLAQLRAAEAAMAAFPAARWLVVLHHHLIEYPQPGAPLADRIGTALVNGAWLLGRLRRQAPRLVVLHGHRHRDWMGACGGVRILSAPSPVMGGRDDTPRHVWLHRLAPAPDGRLALLAPVRMDVPGG
jgi:hypothetical protein